MFPKLISTPPSFFVSTTSESETRRAYVHPLSPEGFIINVSRLDMLPQHWLDLIADVTARIRRVYPLDVLHSIYVCGTVAAGHPQDFFSDLDLTLVFQNEVPDDLKEVASRIENESFAKFPFFSHLDLDFSVLKGVLSGTVFESKLLAFNGCCVDGDSVIPYLEPVRRESLDILPLYPLFFQRFNADLAKIADEDADLLKREARWVSKKVLRMGFECIKHMVPFYTRSPLICFQACQSHMPEYYLQLNHALSQYLDPAGTKQDIQKLLQLGKVFLRFAVAQSGLEVNLGVMYAFEYSELTKAEMGEAETASPADLSKLFSVSSSQLQKNDLKEALKGFQFLQYAYLKQGNLDSYLEVLLRRIDIVFKHRDVDQAIDRLIVMRNWINRHANDTNRDRFLAKYFLKHGFVSEKLGHYREARSYYEQALHNSLLDSRAKPPAICFIYQNIGAVCLRQLRPHEALSVYTQGLEYIQSHIKAPNPSSVSLKQGIGQTHHTLKNYALAEAFLMDARKECDAMRPPNLRTLASILGDLAKLKEDCAEIETALTLYDEALRLNRSLFKREGVPAIAGLYFHIGLLYIGLPDGGEKARESLEKSAELYRECSKTHPFIGSCYIHLGKHAMKMGDYEQASDYFVRASEPYLLSYGVNHYHTVSAIILASVALEKQADVSLDMDEKTHFQSLAVEKLMARIQADISVLIRTSQINLFDLRVFMRLVSRCTALLEKLRQPDAALSLNLQLIDLLGPRCKELALVYIRDAISIALRIPGHAPLISKLFRDESLVCEELGLILSAKLALTQALFLESVSESDGVKTHPDMIAFMARHRAFFNLTSSIQLIIESCHRKRLDLQSSLSKKFKFDEVLSKDIENYLSDYFSEIRNMLDQAYGAFVRKNIHLANQKHHVITYFPIFGSEQAFTKTLQSRGELTIRRIIKKKFNIPKLSAADIKAIIRFMKSKSILLPNGKPNPSRPDVTVAMADAPPEHAFFTNSIQALLSTSPPHVVINPARLQAAIPKAPEPGEVLDELTTLGVIHSDGMLLLENVAALRRVYPTLLGKFGIYAPVIAQTLEDELNIRSLSDFPRVFSALSEWQPYAFSNPRLSTLEKIQNCGNFSKHTRLIPQKRDFSHDGSKGSVLSTQFTIEMEYYEPVIYPWSLYYDLEGKVSAPYDLAQALYVEFERLGLVLKGSVTKHDLFLSLDSESDADALASISSFLAIHFLPEFAGYIDTCAAFLFRKYKLQHDISYEPDVICDVFQLIDASLKDAMSVVSLLGTESTTLVDADFHVPDSIREYKLAAEMSSSIKADTRSPIEVKRALSFPSLTEDEVLIWNGSLMSELDTYYDDPPKWFLYSELFYSSMLRYPHIENNLLMFDILYIQIKRLVENKAFILAQKKLEQMQALDHSSTEQALRYEECQRLIEEKKLITDHLPEHLSSQWLHMFNLFWEIKVLMANDSVLYLEHDFRKSIDLPMKIAELINKIRSLLDQTLSHTFSALSELSGMKKHIEGKFIPYQTKSDFMRSIPHDVRAYLPFVPELLEALSALMPYNAPDAWSSKLITLSNQNKHVGLRTLDVKTLSYQFDVITPSLIQDELDLSNPQAKALRSALSTHRLINARGFASHEILERTIVEMEAAPSVAAKTAAFNRVGRFLSGLPELRSLTAPKCAILTRLLLESCHVTTMSTHQQPSHHDLPTLDLLQSAIEGTHAFIEAVSATLKPDSISRIKISEFVKNITLLQTRFRLSRV